MSKTFKKISELDPRTVMVVDALNLAFRWKHSGDTDFLESYIRTIDSLRKSYNAGKVIIACDQGSSSYRKQIYPEYKQNRKDKFAEQTPEEQLQFELFFTEFNRVMKHYTENSEYPLFRFDKCEADDVAAYIVKQKQKYCCDNVVLVSSDRDWDLLVSDTVMRFSYVTRKEITAENWSEHYDYNIDDHISIKCLTGDSGDNIPGVPGIGPKKAHQLVRDYGSTYDIIANLPIASKYKFIASLNEFGQDKLLLNYQLMDLLEFCDAALGEQNCQEIDTTLEMYLNGIIN
jgi:5'-3' exonuclease